MLSSLKELLVEHLSTDEPEDAREHTLQLATAALLLEISRSDADIQKEELELIRQRLRDRFDLDDSEMDALLDQAESSVDTSVSLHEFTRVVNDHLSRQERVHIVELLWQVAFADGVLDKHEEFYVRKIADLLYVSQKDFIQTKHRAGYTG
jgi:uncharacterized tellurite resistance protein B-like protein